MRPAETAEAVETSPSAEVILDVLSKAGAIFFRWDPAVGLTFLSASPKGLLGYTQAEVMNDPDLASRVLDPKFLPEFSRMGARFYVDTGEAVRVSMPFISRDGGRVWMETRVVLELGSNGAVKGFLGIAFEAPQQDRERAAPPETSVSP